jgi:23S rRNA-/tRNA-specific pseudouridylate synthase
MTEPDSQLNAQRLDTIIPEHLAGRRFDQALAELFPDFSRSRLTAWIKSGAARLGGEVAAPRQIVRGGEPVELDVVMEREIGAQAGTHFDPAVVSALTDASDQLLTIKQYFEMAEPFAKTSQMTLI